MSNKTYQLQMDSYNRMTAEVAQGVTVGIKVLSLTDTRRIEKKEHAYVVLDIDTPFGTIRIRDIRIVWSVPNKQFYLRWRQWRTGKMRNDRAEYLDVAGPRDKETRLKYSELILGVFEQIRTEGNAGTLGQAHSNLGKSNPKLAELKASLEQEPAVDDTDISPETLNETNLPIDLDVVAAEEA